MLLTPPVFRRLCRARDLLATPTQPLPSVRDVAREVRISPFHFIRQFEAVFGLTPHQFRTARRIECAKYLLARGELTITEVCLEVGFSSFGSFSALFTRHVGVSPSKYRRQVRTLVQVSGGRGDLDAILAPGCLNLMALAAEHRIRNFGEAPAIETVLLPTHRNSKRGTR